MKLYWLLIAGLPAAGALCAQTVTIPTGSMPMSAVVSRDGKYLLTLNAGIDPPSVSVVELASAAEVSRVPVPDAWLGLTLSRAGDRVYAGGGARAAVYEFTFAGGELKPSRVFPVVADSARKPEDFIGDVQLSPDGRLLYAAELYRDSVAVINPQSGLVIAHFKTGRRPFRILFHPSGKSFYVSSWAEGTVSRHESATGNRLTTVRVAPHTTDMVWLAGDVEDHPDIKARLFVSAGNTNSVHVLAANEAGDLSRFEMIRVGLTPSQPAGMTPAGMSLSPDRLSLYVACSDADAVAVVDLSGPRGRASGFLPTGSYPLTALALAGGRIAALSASGVQLLDASRAQAHLDSPYSDQKRDAPGLAANGPLRHVIYILDGSLGPNDSSTPNREKLAREFVRLNNFHTSGASAEEGRNWATAGIAPAYTRLLSPASRAGRRPRSDFDWQEPANSPPAGYLWTNAAQAGIKLENFGMFVSNLARAVADGTQIADVHDPVLGTVTEASFRGPDPAYPDTARAQAFISSLKEFEKAGSMPQLLMVKLGQDKPLPAAAADNDKALGAIVEAVSRSRFWPNTAIFIVPEGGSDSAAPSPAWVVSPFVTRRSESSTFYNHASMLRSIEMILGLHPMTTFDSAAAPLFDLFTEAADNSPWSAVANP